MSLKNKLLFGISAFTLHALAMLFMLCDHIRITLIPNNIWQNYIGRLAFPIFAFMLVEGVHYSHDKANYIVRVLIFAFLSEIPFDLMISGKPVYLLRQNVMWTLLISLCCIIIIDLLRQNCHRWVTIAGAVVTVFIGWITATLLRTDYFGEGVLTVVVFYIFRGAKWWQKAAQIIALYWINCVLLTGIVIPIRIMGCAFEIPMQGFALLSLVFIWLYQGRQGFHNRTVQLACYAFYPCHMLLLVLLAKLQSA